MQRQRTTLGLDHLPTQRRQGMGNTPSHRPMFHLPSVSRMRRPTESHTGSAEATRLRRCRNRHWSAVRQAHAQTQAQSQAQSSTHTAQGQAPSTQTAETERQSMCHPSWTSTCTSMTPQCPLLALSRPLRHESPNGRHPTPEPGMAVLRAARLELLSAGVQRGTGGRLGAPIRLPINHIGIAARKPVCANGRAPAIIKEWSSNTIVYAPIMTAIARQTRLTISPIKREFTNELRHTVKTAEQRRR